jgi:flagellar hook-length control protein FliK
MSGPSPLVPITPLSSGTRSAERAPAKSHDDGPSFAAYMSGCGEDEHGGSLDDESARRTRALAAAGAAALPQAPAVASTATAFALVPIADDAAESPGEDVGGALQVGQGSVGAGQEKAGAPAADVAATSSTDGEPLVDPLLSPSPSASAPATLAKTDVAHASAPEAAPPPTDASVSSPAKGAAPVRPQAHATGSVAQAPSRNDAGGAKATASTPDVAPAPSPAQPSDDPRAAVPPTFGPPTANGDRSVVNAHPRASLESGAGAKGDARAASPSGARASKARAAGDAPATPADANADAGSDPRLTTSANVDPAAPPAANDASAVKPMAPVTKLAAAPATDPASAARLREAFASAANHSVLRGAASGEIDVPELGRVAVRARNVGGAVDVDITADRGDVRAALKLHSGAMTSDLRQADVRVGRLTIEQGHSPAASDGSATGRSFDAPARRDQQRPGEHDTDDGSAREGDEAPTAGGGRVRIVL